MGRSKANRSKPCRPPEGMRDRRVCPQGWRLLALRLTAIQALLDSGRGAFIAVPTYPKSGRGLLAQAQWVVTPPSMPWSSPGRPEPARAHSWLKHSVGAPLCWGHARPEAVLAPDCAGPQPDFEGERWCSQGPLSAPRCAPLLPADPTAAHAPTPAMGLSSSQQPAGPTREYPKGMSWWADSAPSLP